MAQELIPYLTRHNGANLERILPGLVQVGDEYRFDSNRFDILSYNREKDVFFGIKGLRAELSLKNLQKIIDDAQWLQKFHGNSIILIPAEKTEYTGLFREAIASGVIMARYYSIKGKEYLFTEAPENKIAASMMKNAGTAAKMLVHPQVINYVLGKIGKKSEVFRIAKLAYSVYRKVGR